MEEKTYENYVKVQDILLQLGKGCTLTFNLALYSFSDRYQKKLFYYSEVSYYHQRFKENVSNIKRKFEPYLAIEQVIPNADIKNFVMVRQDDIMEFRSFLNTVYQEIRKSYTEIFYMSNGKINAKTDDSLPVFTFNDLPLGGSITIVPSVMNVIESPIIGILLYIGDQNHPIELTIPRFSSLVETVNNMDMMLYAQNIMSYIGRPPFGTNGYDPNGKFTEQNTKEVTGRKGRTIPGPKDEFDFFE